MIAGAVGGFVIAKSMKTKTLVQIGATVGGSLLLGVPVLLMTRKKAVERTKKIKENEETIKGLQSLGVMTNVVKQNLPNLDMFNEMMYVTKAQQRKGGYNEIVRNMVIAASLMKGNFHDSFLWALQ